MVFTRSELHRLAYFTACRDLSDQARGQVSTYGEAHRRSGELVEDAVRLVGQADEVLRLAVAAERAASTSWQEIGERLGVTRQSAHERFARIVDEISDGVLFPDREPAREGDLGWWACPDGLEDPERTVGRLDEWARQHRTPTDIDHGRHPVSDGLGQREGLAAIEAIGVVTALAKRLMDGDLPPGVSERRARRTLLERKVEAFGLVASREHGAGARAARTQASAAWEELVTWHREDLEPRVTVDSVQNAGLEGYRFALDGRQVADLQFAAEGGDEDTGWFLWSIDAQAFEASPDTPLTWLGDPWPVDVAGVDVDALVKLGREHGREALLVEARRVAQRTRAGALTAVRAQLLTGLASDLAKGVRPFELGGTAGPRAAEQAS
jgi:hypothetical protein